MFRELNAQQHQCVEAIIGHVRQYLALRSVVTVRANPRMKDLWPNLQWTIITQLRKTLENDKMWGPNRFVIGEVLCSDDKHKIRDIFNPTNQVSIQTEVVDKKDTSGHTTADILEIHDFRSLYSSIEPSVATAPNVIQIYIWWDLPDACDLARIDLKSACVRLVRERGASDALRARYAALMGRADTEAPTAEEIIIYELRRIRENIQHFHRRRHDEPGYQIVPAAKPRAACGNSDPLVTEIARELSVLSSLESGSPMDPKLRAQFAKALRVADDAVTNEAAATLLRQKIIDNKIKLREMLADEADGDYYNFKWAQFEQAEKQLKELMQGIDPATLDEEAPAMQSGSGYH